MPDYKNPLHLEVADRYLRRMGNKTIPDEAPPSQAQFYPPWFAGIDLLQSMCCGFFASFTNKKHILTWKKCDMSMSPFVSPSLSK